MILNDFTHPRRAKFSREQLDSLLADLCGKVIEGQNDAPDFYGMVAAAVIDPEGRVATGVNYLYGNERIHAERVAIDNYEEEYGELPKGSIVVTTLSPCNQDTGDIKEVTCTEVLNEKHIKLAYCGYRDPTQHNERNNFTVIITNNEKIQHLCKKLAATFLKKDVDDAGIGINVYEGGVNPITGAGATQLDDPALRKPKKEPLVKPVAAIPGGVKVDIKQHDQQSPQTYSKHGKVTKENFADGKGPGRPGDSVRHGIPKHATKAELEKASHAKGRKGQLARWQLNMRNGHKK